MIERWERFLERLYSTIVLPDNDVGDAVAITLFSAGMISYFLLTG